MRTDACGLLRTRISASATLSRITKDEFGRLRAGCRGSGPEFMDRAQANGRGGADALFIDAATATPGVWNVIESLAELGKPVVAVTW